MVRNLMLGALVALAVTIYAVIQCVQTPANRVRSIAKPWWILAIILLPLIGALLWFWLGRPDDSGSGPSQGQRPTRGPAAPDDDPDFLRSLETQRRQRAKEEDLRRREAELRAREEQARKNQNPPHDDGTHSSDQDSNPPSS
ncbi:MAG: PLDc N-terminal domain-containing protein [Arthrobacter sp.]|uniref:PLDc N-terminal domain-containing protein n=1 Tax=Arthrobacter sp. AOP36-A1-22 TaxID=3457684 RepID=UPI00264F1700|nr:PLDc N-terminal domain-containing protein [Micrococcaceae bacterium]MDN5824513.1 PLDc N-terminal domain-containing protein [Micrococcaceae bacterium]MDN6177398.1 PLDc N-terminal domain-containing protein [Micrococcaceae bacterium]MDN6299553.1 PLDc N-terminal domain-containing protein [Micrococcaceae bacterium]